MFVTINSGNKRKIFEVAAISSERREAAAAIKRYLFPTNGAYYQAKRRGIRALQVAA